MLLRTFFEPIERVFLPILFSELANYLPFAVNSIILMYYFWKKKTSRGLLYVLLFCSCLFLFSILRDVEVFSKNKEIIAFSFYSVVVLFSSFYLPRVEKFFSYIKYLMYFAVLLTPLLFIIYFNAWHYKIEYDYMLLGTALTPLCNYFIFDYKIRGKKTSIVMFLVYLVLILLFCNRGALILSTVAFLIVFLSLKGKYKIRLFVEMVVVVVLSLVFLRFTPLNIDQLNSSSRTLTKIFNHSITTDSGRSKYTDLSLEYIKQNVWSGVGIEESRGIIFNGLNLKHIDSAYPHNIFLEIILQYGCVIGIPMIGLGVLLIIRVILVARGNMHFLFVFLYFLITFLFRLFVSGSYLIDFGLPLTIGVAFKIITENKRMHYES